MQLDQEKHVEISPRAQRRHDNERLKKNRSDKKMTFRTDERGIGMKLHTNTLCSCWMCGNPRKFFDERTIQERRFIEGHEEEVQYAQQHYEEEKQDQMASRH